MLKLRRKSWKKPAHLLSSSKLEMLVVQYWDRAEVSLPDFCAFIY
jgi:hypothetical protein